MQGVADTIDSGGQGYLILYAGTTVVSTIQLASPCGTVGGGVLTFGGQLLDPAAANSGTVDQGAVTDGAGNMVITGLTVGIPGSTGVDIVISNGLNSTYITAGQTVELLSAQITGS